MNKQNNWFWKARCTHWVFKIPEKRTKPVKFAPCMDSYFAGGIDANEMEKAARAFRDAGINMIFTESLRRMMLFECEGKTAQVIKTMKMAVKACHREGIKVIHHITASFANQELNKLPESQLDWLSVDARTGQYAYLEQWGGWYLWCLNNPNFRTDYFHLCKKIIVETEVDGFMVDEVYFRTGWHSCACQYCRDKYRQMSGNVLPDGDDDSFWGNFDNSAFKDWLRFRCVSVGDFYADLYKLLSESHPHPILLGCKSAEMLEHSQHFGDNETERMRGINLLFIELSATNTALLYSWRILSANLMIYASLSGEHEIPTISIMYHQSAERFFSWALRMAHGMRIQATSSQISFTGALGPESHLLNYPKDYQAYAELFSWEKKHEDELSGNTLPFANIGILFGESTRDMLDHGVHLNFAREFIGWCEFLIDSHLQYTVIFEKGLTLAQLQNFSLIILPDVVCLNHQTCQLIAAYVEDGGNLILTNKTGERNSEGEKKAQEFHLSSILKINQESKDTTGVDLGTFGHGKWAYFTNRPGVTAFTTINQINTLRKRDSIVRPVSEKERSLQNNVMLNVIKRELETPKLLTIKNTPGGILIKAFKKKINNSIVIHILNCCGEKAVNFDELIPSEYNVDFPKLDRDIILELNLPIIKLAYLFSPDWDGKRPVDFKKMDNGRFMLIIPADSLHRYEVLYVET